ncbi:MAG TPA: Uma2 family endonuclease [Isosphaeraceae bacterium]|nr:Uma2 family endonuclease [Isosphaeraceae bacterium]
MATVATAESRRPPPTQAGVILHDVTWNQYEAMLRIVGERPIRVTYDTGTMELFMPSLGHESDAYLLGRMVDMLTEELEISMMGGGTTTHKRQDLDKGAEPDQCYWFGENAQRIRGKRTLDLDIDPAPDLVIEVDVTRGSLDRLRIFAALGVLEVWRSDGETLQFLHLLTDGSYQPGPISRSFPGLPVFAVAQFLEQGRASDTTAWVRSFRAFVREQVVPQNG